MKFPLMQANTLHIKSLKLYQGSVVCAMCRCGSTEEIATSKATWVTSLICFHISINLPSEYPTPRFDPLQWKNPQRKREQLGSDLETLLGYTLVGVVLNTSQGLQPAHIFLAGSRIGEWFWTYSSYLWVYLESPCPH